MDRTTWAKLHGGKRLSWHVETDPGATRCGRWLLADAPRANDLPLGDRSCESCLRLVARDQERAG